MSKHKIHRPAEERKAEGYWAWLILLAVILFTAAIRIRLLDVPFERDEGEYAYAGRLILEGVPPYSQAYNMKMPGVYAAYAAIMAIFGQSIAGVRTGLLVINAGTIILLFLLGKELFGTFAGIVGAAAFAVLSAGQRIQGVFANAEHFVILAAVGGIFLLIRGMAQRKLALLAISGILLGIAFVMKQHGAAFILFAGTYLFLQRICCKPLNVNKLAVECLVFSAGLLLPIVITCLILWQAGTFGKFWFWTFEYAQKYVSNLPVSIGLRFLRTQFHKIVGPAFLLWTLAGIGMISLPWNKKARTNSLFTVLFLFFSFLAICPGFYFREHYFILMLPAVALAVGIGVDFFRQFFAAARSGLIAGLLFIIALVHNVWIQREFFFVMTPVAASRSIYDINPFPESIEIARFIRENSTKEDRIAVAGSEPQIYFYSDRRSATGYIYTYPLMENHPYAEKMQREMIAEMESARPKFIVYVNNPLSWVAQPYSKNIIFEWLDRYTSQHYQRVGIVDMIRPDFAVYHWGREAQRYSPASRFWISIWQRKDG